MSNLERIARAMAVAMGGDPDALHTIGMGFDRRKVPYWQLQLEWARRHLAAQAELAAIAKEAADAPTS